MFHLLYLLVFLYHNISNRDIVPLISWVEPVKLSEKSFLFIKPFKRDKSTSRDFIPRSAASRPKGGEMRGTKTLNLSRNIVSLQVFVDVSRFSPCVINLSRNKNTCCGLKKVVAKSRAWVYFEQQILVLLLVFHQTHNLSRNKFARALKINQSARRFSSTCNKCFCCGVMKNGKHRQKLATKQCYATSWGFLYLVFRRLKQRPLRSLTYSTLKFMRSTRGKSRNQWVDGINPHSFLLLVIMWSRV